MCKNTCDPVIAKNDETLCRACGWEWKKADQFPGGETYACGGDNFCQAYNGGTWEEVSYQNNGLIISYACYNGCDKYDALPCVYEREGTRCRGCLDEENDFCYCGGFWA